MRYFAFLFYTLILCAFAMLAGCSGQPLDLILDQSDRHSSEIVDDLAGCYKGLVVDAENDSYFVQFSKVCVDGVITGTEASMPTLPPGVTATDIQTIVSDTAGGNNLFSGRFVGIEATVEDVFDDGGLLLKTGTEKVWFIVSDLSKNDTTLRYEVGQRYMFSLFIDRQKPREHDDGFYVYALIASQGGEIQPVSLQALVDDAKAGTETYQGRAVRLNASVRSNLQTIITLKSEISFSIRKNGHPQENAYQPEQNYPFAVFIGKIGIDTLTQRPIIRATLINTSTDIVKKPVVDTTETLSDIVNDVASNGTRSGFIGQEVEIDGTVQFNFVVRSDKGGISLETGNPNIFFYITDYTTPDTLRGYAEGQTYTFKVLVRQVLRSTTDAGIIYIYSHEVE